MQKKKTITEKNFFSEKKPFMQKILQIKVYNFFQLYNHSAKKIDHKKYIY